MNASPLIKHIDLPALAEGEGVQLRNTGGGRMVGLCPFHPERTPSFTVFPNNSFHCFGCTAHGGDAVDFIRQLHGLTFSAALSYLQIETRPTNAQQFAAIKKRIREAEAKKLKREAREKRERDLVYTFGTILRRIASASLSVKPGNIDILSDLYREVHWWEWGFDVLIHGSPKEKAFCLWSFQGYRTIERGQIFRENFDFSGWLRAFLKNGATVNGQQKAM